MKTQPMKHQREMLDRMAGKRVFALLAEMGTGKALRHDQRVLTPDGWVAIADLAVGQTVFAFNGEACRVDGVYPQGIKPIFKIKFKDRTEVLCTEDHLWEFSTQESRQKFSRGKLPSPWTVAPIVGLPTEYCKANNNKNLYIKKADAVEFSPKPLPIPPYTLGVLIGDGCLVNDVLFSSADSEMADKIETELPSGSLRRYGAIDHRITAASGYRAALRDLGLLGHKSYTKFIPEIYKFSCRDDRLALLRGLMDADGTQEKSGTVFATASPRLAEDIAELVRGLGGQATIRRRTNVSYRRDGVRIPAADGWPVGIKLDVCPFSLKRKAEKWKAPTKYTYKHKVVVAIEAFGEAEAVCISIDHPSRLFITEGHTATHNTWGLLANAERLYAKGTIDGVLVVAPNGVHTNWVKREIPTHMEGDIIARAWRSGPSKSYLKHVEELFRPRDPGDPVPLRILTISYDALITKAGREICERFLLATKALMILDESSSIKSPDAARTKACLELRRLAVGARIADGTPITKAPVDLFSQFEFLAPGLLGTTSYRAFVSEYADLVPTAEAYSALNKLRSGQPTTVAERAVLNSIDYGTRKKLERNPRMQYAQIVRRGEDGAPAWRNLDKLKALIEPHSFRVLKKDCLDLPEKVYQVHPFELSDKQRTAYDLMEEQYRITLAEDSDESVLTVSELAALSKLQQITSGFVKLPGTGEVHYVSEHNPRLSALMSIVERVDGKFIVWAKYHEELDAIAAAMEEAGVECVQYHGRVGRELREDAIDRFQNGTARCFLGNAQAGGIGITLTAASTAIYFSNDFNLRLRLQSEDRCHRIGTKTSVLYIDLVADNTIDEAIARNLQRKKSLAALVLGDNERDAARDNSLTT